MDAYKSFRETRVSEGGGMPYIPEKAAVIAILNKICLGADNGKTVKATIADLRTLSGLLAQDLQVPIPHFWRSDWNTLLKST